MNNTGKIRFALFFLGLILFFFVGRRIIISLSDVAGHCVSYLVYPFLLLQHKVVTPIKGYMQKRKTSQELAAELDLVCAQRDSLQAEVVALKAQTNKYNEIKELLEFKKRFSPDYAFIGQIIMKQFSPQEHFFLINRGNVHGIQSDMIAVYNNSIIGRVTQVYPWYCKVIAVTDRNCKIVVFCEKTKSCGIHVGMNQLEETNLERLSHLLPVQKGDLILSSGEGLVFPRGFALGRIKNYKKKDLWYEIKVKPLVALEKITSCLLLHKSTTS